MSQDPQQVQPTEELSHMNPQHSDSPNKNSRPQQIHPQNNAEANTDSISLLNFNPQRKSRPILTR
jgi:hypothetical protein